MAPATKDEVIPEARLKTTLGGVPWRRKETEVLNIPKELPNATNVSVWLANEATALAEASIYYDKADVPWLMKACEPDSTSSLFMILGSHDSKVLTRCWPRPFRRRSKRESWQEH